MNHDRARIAVFMLRNHCGFKNATPRREIAKALGYDDRRFRRIYSLMPEIITNSKKRAFKIDFFNTVTVRPGIYILPLVDNGIETKIALALMAEQKSRIKKLSERIHATEAYIHSRNNKQSEMAYA